MNIEQARRHLIRAQQCFQDGYYVFAADAAYRAHRTAKACRSMHAPAIAGEAVRLIEQCTEKVKSLKNIDRTKTEINRLLKEVRPE